MKKALLIIGSIVALVAIVVACAGIYITNTPEYALKKIMEDVQESGMEGLRPHLTAEACETVDAVTSIAENTYLKKIVGFFGKSDYASALKSEIQEIQWNVYDVLKGKENADVILSFNYEDMLTGTIEILMIRINGRWKINGIEIQKFDVMN